MTMFKLIDRILVAHILVMLMNGEVYEFQMLFGIWGTPHCTVRKWICVTLCYANHYGVAYMNVCKTDFVLFISLSKR